MPHPDYTPPTPLEMLHIQAAQRAVDRAVFAVHDLSDDHPALAHLQAAADEIEQVAFGYELPQVPA